MADMTPAQKLAEEIDAAIWNNVSEDGDGLSGVAEATADILNAVARYNVETHWTTDEEPA